MPVTNIDVKDAAGVTRNINAIPNPGQAANAASQPVALSTEQDAKLDTMVSSLAALVAELNQKLEIISTDYAPRYNRRDDGGSMPATDPDGNLVTRGQVLTDEGTFRVNFANSSLEVSVGTVTVAGAVVTGTFPESLDVNAGDYFKVFGDPDTAWVQIESVDSLSQLTLASAYTGTTGAGLAGVRSLVQPVIGAGGAISVASGQATMTLGTTAAVTTSLVRAVDYAPLVFRARLSISNRIANQDTLIGLRENVAAPRWFARFRANGTTATSIILETGRNPTGAPSASEIEQQTITLPGGLTTTTQNTYRVEVLTESVRFYVNGFMVGENEKVIPSQHDVMAGAIDGVNGTTPGSSTTILVDYITAKNHNKVEIGVLSDNEKIVASPAQPQTFTYSFTGVIAINTDVLIIDCAQFAELSIHCQAMGTTGVVTAAWCATPDFAVPVTATLYSESGASSTTFNAAVLRKVNRQARYLRLRMTTATTAGTTTIVVTGYPTPSAPVVATQPVSGTVTANIGTGSLAAGTNTIGGVRLVADAGQGASTTHRQAFVANITTGGPTSVKASAGTINSGRIANNSGTAVWVHFYNKASAPTLGTDTPVESVFVKAGDTIPLDTGGFGDRFSTGIAYAVCDNCAAIPTAGGTITIASTAAAICVSLFYT